MNKLKVEERKREREREREREELLTQDFYPHIYCLSWYCQL